jgi:hypothetical protein
MKTKYVNYIYMWLWWLCVCVIYGYCKIIQGHDLTMGKASRTPCSKRAWVPSIARRGVHSWGLTLLMANSMPIGSMYAIYGNIYHPYTPNVSIYTIHGSYGMGMGMSMEIWVFEDVAEQGSWRLWACFNLLYFCHSVFMSANCWAILEISIIMQWCHFST